MKWKALVDTAGIKSADLKDKFLFYSLAAFQTAYLDVGKDVLAISMYVAKVLSESVT